AAAGYEAPQQDTFSIYQLRGGEETRDYRFEPYERLQAAGLAVDSANYDLVYTAPLDKSTSLEDIYRTFNIDHPADFRGHSLSVSDVVVLHQNGQDTAHYVDSFGYMEVPEFLRENPLRTAELSTEQNENMIDGIINNTPPEPQPEEPEQLSFEDVAVASGQ
ncbi:TPA: YodL domain-containing protein, partial [Enterococcus faecium]